MFQIMEKKARKLKKFLMKAENYRRENEFVKIHHKSKVNFGTCNVNENQTVEIKIQREQEWNNYKDSIKTCSEEDLFERQQAKKIKQRILRISLKVHIFENNEFNYMYFFENRYYISLWNYF